MACVPPLPPSGHGGSHVFRTCMSYARCAVYTASAIRREQSAIEKREREEEEEENDDRNCKNEVRTGGIRDEVGRHAERLPKERGGGEMPHTSPNATRWDAPVGAHIAFGTLLGRLPTHARNQKKKETGNSSRGSLRLYVAVSRRFAQIEYKRNAEPIPCLHGTSHRSETCMEIGNTLKRKKGMLFFFCGESLLEGTRATTASCKCVNRRSIKEPSSKENKSGKKKKEEDPKRGRKKE